MLWSEKEPAAGGTLRPRPAAPPHGRALTSLIPAMKSAGDHGAEQPRSSETCGSSRRRWTTCWRRRRGPTQRTTATAATHLATSRTYSDHGSATPFVGAHHSSLNSAAVNVSSTTHRSSSNTVKLVFPITTSPATVVLTSCRVPSLRSKPYRNSSDVLVGRGIHKVVDGTPFAIQKSRQTRSRG